MVPTISLNLLSIKTEECHKGCKNTFSKLHSYSQLFTGNFEATKLDMLLSEYFLNLDILQLLQFLPSEAAMLVRSWGS